MRAPGLRHVTDKGPEFSSPQRRKTTISITPFSLPVIRTLRTIIVALRASLRRMTHYKIDIVSDTVCPWCYVGKNRLEKAIATHKQKHPEDTFATTWHPFYLNPDAPKSIDKQEYYERKVW